MQTEPVNDLYTTVLQYATLPVIIFILGLSWIITNRILSPEWQQARRNRQIRKAVAARQARFAASLPGNEKMGSDEPKNPSD